MKLLNNGTELALTILTIYCDTYYDGFLLWKKTPAGEIAYQNCPKSIYGWSEENQAHKQCYKNRTWSKDPVTSYKNCSNFSYTSIKQNQLYEYFEVAGDILSTSTMFTVSGMYCFLNLGFGNRRCIQHNAFAAQALRGIFNLLYIVYSKSDITILLKFPYLCIILKLIINYVDLVAYFWLLSEELIIYRTLVLVFSAIDYTTKLMIVGWIAPMAIILIYFTIRFLADEIDTCMMAPSYAYYAISGPVFISVIVSLYAVLQIARILHKRTHNILENRFPITTNHKPTPWYMAVKPMVVMLWLMAANILLGQFQLPGGSTSQTIYEIFVLIMKHFQPSQRKLLKWKYIRFERIIDDIDDIDDFNDSMALITDSDD